MELFFLQRIWIVQEEIALYPYERVKDFKCLSERTGERVNMRLSCINWLRTVMIIVQPPKKAADVETYYRSLEVGRVAALCVDVTLWRRAADVRLSR